MVSQEFKYLIVGGGMAADAAVRGIRQIDPQGRIGLISNEPDPPYNRPPLSKGLWKRTPLERIWRNTSKQGAETILNRTVMHIHPAEKQVVDSDHVEYTYQKLLLATGGSPIRLPFGENRVIYFRYLSDYRNLRLLAENKQIFVVIGGGFIGSEIAAALNLQHKQVTILFLEEGIGGNIFPPSLALYLSDYYRSKGVRVLPGQSVVAIEEGYEGYIVRTSHGEEIFAEGVVAGLGIRPNLTLAREAGLKIENGIVVDSSLRTSHPDIYAAGDAIAFYNPALNRRIRVEHEENANQSGLLAGQAMAGKEIHYDLLPMAYSDLFDLGYQMVGDVNPRLQVIEDWQEPFKKGVLYYLESGRVRGVLLWNVWGKIDLARELISSPGPFRTKELKGKIA
jgi:3-phenylpropionate/trans-cinnamate dioxygenase ferredoxin reductase component